MKNKIIGLTAISAILVSAVFGSSIALASNHECGSCNNNPCHDDDKSCHKDCHCDSNHDCDDCAFVSGPYSLQFRQIAENGDYRSWRNVMWRYGYLSSFHAVNERNFHKYIKAMRRLDCGDIAEAKKILKCIDKDLLSYTTGYKVGYVTGYHDGWNDARRYYTCANGGAGCDAGTEVRVDVYNAGF